MKNRGGSLNNHPSIIGNNQKRNITKNSGQTYAESSNSGDREAYNDLAHSHKSSSTNTSATMETSVVHSIAHLAAATAEDALTVSGLPPPPSSTSLNVSPNHRYTLTTHSSSGDSPAAPVAQLAVRTDGKASSSSPGLASMSGAETSSLGKSIFYDYDDEPDLNLSASYSGSQESKANAAKHLHNLQNKISKTKEMIKKEQTSRDENVNEYLKLSSKADKQAAIRIKQVFEKKNEKSAKNMAQLQKKLDEYERRKRDLETSGFSHGLGQYGNTSSHNSASDMHGATSGLTSHATSSLGGSSKPAQTVRAGLKHVREGVNKVMSKPSDVMNSIMKSHHSGSVYRHHNKFGSDPDISSMSKESDRDSEISNTNKGRSLGREGQYGVPRSDHGSGGKGSIFSSNERTSSFEEKRKCLSEDGRNRTGRNRSTEASESDATSDSAPPPRITQTAAASTTQPQNTNPMPMSPQRLAQNMHRPIEEGTNDTSATEWNAVIQELTQHKEEVQDLREGMNKLRQQFHKEVEDLVYRLQEEGDRCAKLEDQINDLTELHQSQIEHIKNLVNDNEEQAHYQSEERVRDINDKLKMLETKVTNMEIQQVQQQYLHIEGLDSTDARALLMKVITALITVVHVLFFILGTVINIVKPFVRTTTRILATSILVMCAALIYYQQENVVAVFHKFKQRTNIPAGNLGKS